MVVRQAYAVGILSLMLAAWWVCPWCLRGAGEATERTESYALALARARAHDDVIAKCEAQGGHIGTIYTDSDSCEPAAEFVRCTVTVFADCDGRKK